MQPALQTPTPEVIDPVLDLYERGQTLDAFHLAVRFAPLAAWDGIEGCCLAARLADNIGATRLGTRLTLRAWHSDPQHPKAQISYAFELLSRRGPLALWLEMRGWPDPRDPDLEDQALLLSIKADAAVALRDFSMAEELIRRSEALGSKDPWVHLPRSSLLERQDRVEEALEAARAACARHPYPFYRPGVQVVARLLQLLDRDQEAIELLHAANQHLQSGPISVQLYTVLAETGRWEAARPALDRYVELSPLLGEAARKWVTGQRARVAYHLGQRAEAAAFASSVDDDFLKAFAEKLAAPPPEKERVQLEVGFVRQHFKTCAPATLAAIGRYWRLPAEHLKVAESICYDGTPHWQQREWAENNGWFVREFRATFETAKALIERGIPFAITTVETSSSHMMAVSGYDQTRGTLLLRDPGQPYTIEAHAVEFLKRYRPFGPAAVVFIPFPERGRLDGVELPDAEVYDLCHRFWLALKNHQRAQAAELTDEIGRRFPEHDLLWEVRLQLAYYDANHTEQARCLDRLLERYPKNAVRLLGRFSCLRSAPRDEQIRFLRQASSEKEADPVFFIELARVLQQDARSQPEATHWITRALRWRPLDSNAIGVRADLFWNDGRLDEATQLYRFAANLEQFRENLYQTWFIACRGTRRTDEAVRHLQDRFARFGRQSEQPALTLAWAYRELDQPVRAREVLAEAIRLRPDDALLKLRSATLLTTLRENAEADRLLAAARGKMREADWLRGAAELAETRFDSITTLQRCREILRLEPLALDAHAGVARSLARLEGHAAALAHLRSASEQFPHHYGLRKMMVEWSRNAGHEAVEAAARELLLLDPADAWARRELALALSYQNRHEEALREALAGAEIEPRNTTSHSVLGHVCRARQNPAEARNYLRQAVRLDVDNTYAAQLLLDLAHTDNDRKAELQFIENELIAQVVRGDGLMSYLEFARPLLEPEKLLASLRRAHSERPDLWHAWSALISQLGHMGRFPEARELAKAAVEKFPHLPQVWVDLSQAFQWCEDPEQEIRAAEQAFEINPSWVRGTLVLAGALERRHRMEDARSVYERALKHSPANAPLQAYYAHLLWRLRDNEAAFTAVTQAVRLAPGYDWPWGLLIDWSNDCGQTNRPADFARTLVKEQPGEARAALMLARILHEPGAFEERLAAIQKALELEPALTEAWDLKAEILTSAERFDEAIAVCEQGCAACSGDLYVLRGRRAWIEAARRRLPDAVRLMQAVLAENVNYSWGWSQLAGWLMEQGANIDAATALEQLIRLRPREAWVHRQLGFLRLGGNDHAGAQKAFATALQLVPTDSVAARNIFDLQIEANDLAGAAATVELMRLHQPGAGTLAAEIILDLSQADLPAAIAKLEKLCALPDPDPTPIDAATAAFSKRGYARHATKVLKRAIRLPASNPQAGAALMRILMEKVEPGLAVWHFLRIKSREMQKRAAPPLVQGLATNKNGLLFRWLLWRRREVLAADDLAWGQVGYAFARFEQMAKSARWMADWQTRSGVQPWMLFNLCLGLRHLGRYHEADEIARYVVRHWGHREGAADMRIFLAVEAALAGDLPSASEHLQNVIVRNGVPHDQQMLALAKALVEFQQCPAMERPARFEELRQALAAEFGTFQLLNQMRDVRRTFRRAAKVFLAGGVTLQGRTWLLWKLYLPWIISLATLALILLIADFKRRYD